MAIKIFISHRHADKDIADVFRQHLMYWEIPNEEIFQSSSSMVSAPEAGRALTEQLVEAVQQSKVVFLIYTFEEADWSYAMWEVGLAEGDASTNVVVIQCSKVDFPKVFRGRVHVKLELEAIRTFVKQFHTKVGFFPGQPAYKPDLDQQVLKRRSLDLYNALVKVVPPGGHEPRYRWDYLVLQLSGEATKSLIEGDDRKSIDIIKKEGIVIDAWGEALKHFGFAGPEPGLHFGILALRWKENFGEESDAWIGQLCAEIKRAAENRSAECNWEKMRSIFHKDWYFYPILNLAHIHPDGGMDLDIYLYRVPE